jgi:hypothetical protein
MPRFESWSDAYERILGEVRGEHPEWDEPTVFTEYRSRCELWKQERGR